MSQKISFIWSITATVVKDEFLRGWALEAGAIVLANGGLLLDEMDKMTVEDTSALHEAMAQQAITISKPTFKPHCEHAHQSLRLTNPSLVVSIPINLSLLRLICLQH